MDGQQKQKVVIGVLAVLALGAGGYYAFLRDTGPKYEAETEATSVGRKQRKVSATDAKKRVGRKQRKVARKTADEVAPGRKERKKPARTAATGRKSRKRRGKIEKKKKLTPAA